MGTQQPALNQGRNTKNTRHADVGWISRVRQEYFFMFVTVLRKFIIASPSIGKNFRSLFDNLLDERDKAIAGHVWNPTHPNSSETLGRKNFHRNIKISPSGCSWLGFTAALSAFKTIWPTTSGKISPACRFILCLTTVFGVKDKECKRPASDQGAVNHSRNLWYVRGVVHSPYRVWTAVHTKDTTYSPYLRQVDTPF